MSHEPTGIVEGFLKLVHDHPEVTSIWLIDQQYAWLRSSIDWPNVLKVRDGCREPDCGFYLDGMNVHSAPCHEPIPPHLGIIEQEFLAKTSTGRATLRGYVKAVRPTETSPDALAEDYK